MLWVLRGRCKCTNCLEHVYLFIYLSILLLVLLFNFWMFINFYGSVKLKAFLNFFLIFLILVNVWHPVRMHWILVIFLCCPFSTYFWAVRTTLVSWCQLLCSFDIYLKCNRITIKCIVRLRTVTTCSNKKFIDSDFPSRLFCQFCVAKFERLKLSLSFWIVHNPQFWWISVHFSVRWKVRKGDTGQVTRRGRQHKEKLKLEIEKHRFKMTTSFWQNGNIGLEAWII